MQLQVDQWIAEQIPDGATVLELGTGDGQRALRTAALTRAREWILTDPLPHNTANAAQNAGQLAGSSRLSFYSLRADQPWPEAIANTQIAILRNCLHILDCDAISRIFRQVHQHQAQLLLVNCFNLNDPRVQRFQAHTLGANGQVWPQSFILSLALANGLELRANQNFTHDESCALYGPVTALKLAPIQQG